jgi:signal peptidase I
LKKLPKYFTSIKEWAKALLIALLIVLFVRSFCFELTVINTPSMEKSILTGDFIIINKLSYGPRFPKTILSMPFINQRWFSDLFSIPYFRLFGEPDVDRNDVVVFNYPIEDNFPVDHRTYFVKRCMAIPGDTLEIKDGNVIVNGIEETHFDYIQHNYFIKSEKDLDEEFMNSYHITEGGEISQNNDFSFTLNQSIADTLRSKNYIISIKKRIEDANTWDEFVFPFVIFMPLS